MAQRYKLKLKQLDFVSFDHYDLHGHYVPAERDDRLAIERSLTAA